MNRVQDPREISLYQSKPPVIDTGAGDDFLGSQPNPNCQRPAESLSFAAKLRQPCGPVSAQPL